MILSRSFGRARRDQNELRRRPLSVTDLPIRPAARGAVGAGALLVIGFAVLCATLLSEGLSFSAYHLTAFCPAAAIPLARLLRSSTALPTKGQTLRVIAVSVSASLLAFMLLERLNWFALFVSQGIGLDIAVATWLVVLPWRALGPRLRPFSIGRLMLVGGVIGPLAEGLWVAAGCALVAPGSFVKTLLIITMATGLGNVLFFPACLVIGGIPAHRAKGSAIRWRRLILTILAISVFALLFIDGGVSVLFAGPTLLAAIAVTAGSRSAYVSLAVLSAMTVMLSAAGFGPMHGEAIDLRLLMMQGFLLACMGAALPVTIALSRHRAVLRRWRRRFHQTLQREERYRILAEMSADMIQILRVDGTILYASHAAEHLLGRHAAALVGGNVFDWVHSEAQGDMRRALQGLGSEIPEVAIEARLRRDGREAAVGLKSADEAQYFWAEMRIRVGRRMPGGVVEYVMVTRDISARRAAEAERAADLVRLGALAHTDKLTGLPNRRRFDDALERAWYCAVRDDLMIGLLVIDVDRFKAYNDRFGHPAGDQALRRIGAVIGEAAHRPGDLAARIGGEEFAVLLLGASAPGAKLVAERIAAAVADLRIWHPDSASLVVSVSIGIESRRPQSGSDAASLFERADQALYQAKRHRGSIVTAG